MRLSRNCVNTLVFGAEIVHLHVPAANFKIDQSSIREEAEDAASQRVLTEPQGTKHVEAQKCRASVSHSYASFQLAVAR